MSTTRTISDTWEWVAAAHAVQARGAQLIVRQTVTIAYTVELPTGEPLTYKDDPRPRAFRDLDQVQTALMNARLAPAYDLTR